MTTYRLLWLDEKGNTRKSTQIECATDRQAISTAERQTGDYDAVEVREGARPRFVAAVTRIRPEGAEAARQHVIVSADRRQGVTC